MKTKKTNNEAYPPDIVWAFLFFFACIMYAILFHDQEVANSIVGSGLG